MRFDEWFQSSFRVPHTYQQTLINQTIESHQQAYHDTIVKVPLQFDFQPVDIISKQLTKLNSISQYRIHYLGPRWENSAALHRHYSRQRGYEFSDTNINSHSNILFSQSMCHNQFYTNQVYYRAFEGMNPTIDHKNSLIFNSKFEAGNLDCAVKVGPKEYDLFMRVDSNTIGHLFWFYFEISNAEVGQIVKFNLCNMTKSINLYKKGFRPYVCRRNNQGADGGEQTTYCCNRDFECFVDWTQEGCQNVKISAKRLRYEFIYQRINVRQLHELSFTYTFESEAPVRFAYCIPYTYSQMLRDIDCLGHSMKDRREKQNVCWMRGSIGRSLSGIDIPVIGINSGECEGLDSGRAFGESVQINQKKPVIIVIGRLHPGESNGSHTLMGFLRYLCNSEQAASLRQNYIFVFVPMMNPDGVIFGNARTGASGKDLNRQFRTRNPSLFPEVCALKNMVAKLTVRHPVEMFLDFHGHSRKKNMFMFGPSYNLTQPEYYRARIMPKYLSQLTDIFRYYGCSYCLPSSKLSTARAVMLNQMSIPLVYTIQTSVGMYYCYSTHSDKYFETSKWEQLGEMVCRATQQYFETMEQYTELMKTRKLQTNQQSPKNHDFASLCPKKGSANKEIRTQNHKNRKMRIKELKLIKVMEEIRMLDQQDRKHKKASHCNEQDNDTDSQNSQDNLQKNKMQQFEKMVTQCLNNHSQKQRYPQLTNQNPKKHREFMRKSKRNHSSDINNFMKQFMKNITESATNSRKASNITCQGNKPIRQVEPGGTVRSHYNNEKELFQEQKVLGNEHVVRLHEMGGARTKYKKQVFNIKLGKVNMKMFNFSQMVDESIRRPPLTGCKPKRESLQSKLANLNLRKNSEIDDNADIPKKKYQTFEEFSSCNRITGKTEMYSEVKIATTSFAYKSKAINDNETLNQDRYNPTQQSDQGYQEEDTNIKSRKSKSKTTFPVPFYRMKYQTYQKKRQKILSRKVENTHIIQSNPIEFMNIRQSMHCQQP